VPYAMGVCIHLTDPVPGWAKMLADSGVRWIRMDSEWRVTELEKGVCDSSSYDRLVAALKPSHPQWWEVALVVCDRSGHGGVSAAEYSRCGGRPHSAPPA
jgi:hypothetical protein